MVILKDSPYNLCIVRVGNIMTPEVSKREKLNMEISNKTPEFDRFGVLMLGIASKGSGITGITFSLKKRDIGHP